MRPNPLAVAIASTLVLGVVKAIGAFVSGSQAVAASAADSLADAVVSGVNLVLQERARAPADEERPWGHGKAEALASLLQALILAGIVVGIGWGAVQALLSGRSRVPEGVPAIVTMALSMAGSLGISTYLMRAARRTGSLVLRADAVHYRMDLLTGAAVVVGLLVATLTGAGAADAISSLVVCGVMSKDVVALARESVDELMDRPLPADEHARILDVLSRFEGRVLGWHALRTRRSGPHRFVQVHVELSGEMSLREAHRVADEVEHALRASLPGLDAIVHTDVDGEEDALGSA